LSTFLVNLIIKATN